ncbi:hypothetical protein [Clavibacter michiganensis]|uniref:hypothetical protein n=1 Tax=Clavibacter michiganensis TaxID=28447 RepID=UPI001D0BC1CB|nr:hypothetical protein [Clavibacter michiganensis]MDO4044366.1 hypothetical protein [Clavibacter michiganensis]MDO4054222.1 hypothetical protein [Clavibacter michiganensis]MDO4057255.1 hypothetical protein [Clavibacter michiganensis]MDO4069166.1 hypothetical protein [Clavibacter michiganensis]UDM14552.1 hypothetical protein LHJ48_04190 [Clavibacter michiganensis subsp. michiganensis]
MPRRVTAVLLAVSGSVLALAALAASVLAAHRDPERVLVVGELGPGALWEVTWIGGGLALVVAFVVGTSAVTARAHRVIRIGAMSIAVVTAVGVSLLLCLYVLFSMLGTVRYVDVGTVDGQMVAVAEGSSLAGVSVSVGRREGWSFVPAPSSAPDRSPSSMSVDGGPPPSSGGGYRVRRDGDDVVVTFSIAGEEHELRVGSSSAHDGEEATGAR